ncbi:hypothetical protein CMI47_12045 [Candidatus Pacearchaeota archaeon]|jgi:hypothetical protein|nr:hypothetical protein [Candidatus Pacearchaeota archaeon]
MGTTEAVNQLYYIDSEGNYHKCHKLLPDIRRIFGEIEVMNGELVEIITNKQAGKNFKDSLNIGHRSEDAVCAKIKKKYPKAHVMEGYCKGYDIYVPETKKKIEVKQDKKSNYTGNIVVEIEFNGKPSALSTTEADYWVFDDGEIYIWITPETLRQVVEPFKPVKFVGNGDNKEKLAYLIKKDIIKRNALKVDKY